MIEHKFKTDRTQRIRELERELKKRKQHYPDWIRSGKIKRAEADWRILVLEDVIAEIKIAHAAATGEQKTLF